MGVNYKGAIDKFNPYVSQIPTEAYVKVGMFKQQQEEAGIQKIQSTIDSIAGLDIAKQSGKEYLQSRVNELTTTLNKFGYSDLSNADNIRNLQTLATPIYQDMNIQSEVANTFQYRQLVKDQQDAIKSGKAESFSVGYEQEENVKPWLNSKMVGGNFTGGTRTLRGTIDEARKMFNDELSKFKPDSYLTQSSANPQHMVQTETGYKIMDKRRLAEYVMGTMSPDTQELLKRKSWYENVGVSGDTLIKKTIQTVSNETADMLVKAGQYSNLAKIHSNNSEMSKEYEEISSHYKKRHDDIITQTKDELSKMDATNLSKQQKESIYTRLGMSNFASSLAEGIGYSETETKQLENPVWKTVFQADQTSLNNAVTSKNFDVEPVYNADGSFGGFKYTNNTHKHDKTDKDGDGTGSKGVEQLNADGTPKIMETNISLPAGKDDVMKWNYPTYDKITDGFKNSQDQITTGIYTFLKQANINADQYFVKSYNPSANGNGMVEKVSIIKGKEQEVTSLIAALETAVDAELLYASVTTKIGNGEDKLMANPDAQAAINALSPEMKNKFMPALRYITEDKSGKAYVKEVLEKKKQYGNQRAALANVMRQFGELQYGGNLEKLARFKNLTDDQLLEYKNENEVGFQAGNSESFEELQMKDNKYYIQKRVNASATGGSYLPKDTKFAHKIYDLGKPREATPKEVEELSKIKDKRKSLSNLSPNNSNLENSFVLSFNKYLEDNVSKKTENVFTSAFSGMIGQLGTAQKESMLSTILTGEGVAVTDDILKNARFSIAGYTNQNAENPLDKQAKMIISYTEKDADNKAVNIPIVVDMQKILDVNKDPNHPLQKMFKLNDYMSEAITIMMDPYHGARLNDNIKDWNIISDNKGDKALKYRVVWTGDNETNPRQVGLDVKNSSITEQSKAYIEFYVPGKGKVLLKDPTGNPATYTHPALALEFLHTTFEKSSEKQLDDFYIHLRK